MDFLEGTDKEAAFFSFFSEIKESADEIKPLFKLPLVGKMLRHLLTLAQVDNVAALRETEAFEYFADWNVKVHKTDERDVPSFTMYPSDETLRKIANVVLAVGAVVVALVLFRIIRKCCKKAA